MDRTMHEAANGADKGTPPSFIRQSCRKGCRLLKRLGPGLVTGASDDDPSGIATYSQVGAQFGFGMLWTAPFSFPLMVAIQEVSARIGRVTGRGIAGNMRRYYPNWLLYATVALMCVATVINLGADIAAMGDAVRLLFGGYAHVYAVLLALAALALQIFIPYSSYVGILKWLTLALFAYVGTALAVHVPWRHALAGTVWPSMKMDGRTLTALVAVLGTTISPYLFFWQASEEVEDQELSPTEGPLKKAPRRVDYHMRRILVDTHVGMAFSNLVAWFIILAVAVTLHARGVTDIQSSEQAAEALRPVAGALAFALFTVGIVGTGLLAIPVLAGSAAYAVGEAFKWPVGLERKPLHARGFYAVIAGAVGLGLAMTLLHVNTIKALYWSAVINGVVAGPIMIVMMLMASNARVMGELTLSRRLRVLGWAATAVMLACAATMLGMIGKKG